jgi:putative phosphoribosyl transferase
VSAIITVDPELRNKLRAFQDRDQAGSCLAGMLEKYRKSDAIVLAIPSGGVPVGLVVSSHLDLPFDLLIIRKIPIPGNPEAGFGAVSLEGDMVLNDSIVRMLGLSRDEIEELAEPVQRELSARNRIFREDAPFPDLHGKVTILVDDGLASGYTMITAVRLVRRKKPAQIIVAVPTASASTVKFLAEEVDEVVCPNIRSGYSFAVADAYRNWRDLSSDEVWGMLRQHGFLKGG